MLTGHRFLNPRESVATQLLHLFLQQYQIGLVQKPHIVCLLLCRSLLLSLSLGAFAHGWGDVGGVGGRRIPGVVARAGHLVVTVFKSAVQVGIIFVHAARMAYWGFFSDFIGIKSGLSHIKIAAFTVLFVCGARIRVHHLGGGVAIVQTLVLVGRGSCRGAMWLEHGHLQIILVERDFGLTGVRGLLWLHF